jgi:hypothetical protein
VTGVMVFDEKRRVGEAEERKGKRGEKEKK